MNYTITELDKIVHEQHRKLDELVFVLRRKKVVKLQVEREIQELEASIESTEKFANKIEKHRQQEEDKLIAKGLLSTKKEQRERRL